MVTELILIRHGEIRANIDRLWYGTTDAELTELGQQQAKRMGLAVSGKYPEISSIYSSPLKRTMNTAAALGEQLNLEPSAVPGLIEYGLGDLEGTDYESLARDFDFFAKIAASQDFAPENGESVNQVRDRMINAISSIAKNHQGETVAVVGHGAAFGILLTTLLTGKSFPFFDYHMANTGFSHLQMGESAKLVYFNDSAHTSNL